MNSGTMDKGGDGLRELGVGTWGLLRTTPLGDVLRGRLTGRLHPARVIGESGLPAPVRRLVADVVRRTRLWRGERVEVARELLSHFGEGLESGAAAEELVRAFGPARSAARLIRRAKKRQRPLAWRAMALSARAAAVLVALVLVSYGVMAWRYFAGTPTVRVNTLAAYNAPALAVPEEQRAWPRYRAALMAIGPEPEFSFEHPDGRDEGYWQLVEPGEPGFAEVGAWLRSIEPELARVRAAAGMARLGYVAGTTTDWELQRAVTRGGDSIVPEAEDREDNPLMMRVLLPHLAHLRRAARLMDADLRHAAAAGDGARVAADLHTMLGLSVHVAQSPGLIGQMVQAAIVHMACDAITRLVTERPGLIDEAELVALAHRLASLGEGGALRLQLAAERAFFDDLLQRMYTDDGAGDGRLTDQGRALMLEVASNEPWKRATSELRTLDILAGPVYAQAAAGRREIKALYDRILDSAMAEDAIELWARPAVSEVSRLIDELRAQPLGATRYELLRVMDVGFDRASGVLRLCESRVALTQVVIALELHRSRTGRYPDSLAALTPGLIPAVPADPFDGRPVRYLAPGRGPAWAGGRPVLYSIGNDRVDGGGDRGNPAQNVLRGAWVRPAPQPPDSRARPLPTPGDWIVFPFIPPGRPGASAG
ncbi:MAG: hypothetical protein JNJ48_06965 [Phycisphaerae bacterium]|nr:hypothetical protein [Phycisphaerae bacterium]